VTHFCVSDLTVSVGKDDTACECERTLEEFHRGADVGYR